MTASSGPTPRTARSTSLFVQPRDPRREAWDGTASGPKRRSRPWGADAAPRHEDFDSKMAEFDRTVPIERVPRRGRDALPLRRRRRRSGSRSSARATTRCRPPRRGPSHARRRAGADPRDAADQGRGGHRASSAAPPRCRPGGTSAPCRRRRPDATSSRCRRRSTATATPTASRRMAYPSIAGSGPNSCILHYDQSDRQMKDGEVLLNDSGAEYGFYATDITRTYPVNGRFSPEQRAIYDIVLAAQKAALARREARRHATSEVEKAAATRVQREGLVKLGLLSGRPGGDREDVRAPQVHAPRRLALGGPRRARPGLVRRAGADVAAARARAWSSRSSPASTLPANSAGVDPKWWNIGVRIEDTILVTNDGLRVPLLRAPRGRPPTWRRPSGPAGRSRERRALSRGPSASAATRTRSVSSPTRHVDRSLQHAVAVDLDVDRIALEGPDRRPPARGRRARGRREMCPAAAALDLAEEREERPPVPVREEQHVEVSAESSRASGAMIQSPAYWLRAADHGERRLVLRRRRCSTSRRGNSYRKNSDSAVPKIPARPSQRLRTRLI